MPVSVIGLSPHRPSASLHGFHDIVVAGAAADVSLKPFADVSLTGIGVSPREIDGTHDHARRAKPALQSMMLAEGRLHGMQLTVNRQPFNRCYGGAVRLHREHGTGLHRLAVDVYDTGATLAGIAADVRSRQSEMFAQI